MDNLTHSLVGWTLGEAGLKRRTRKGLAALILGANAPDIDVFLGWMPWAPLATHRGVTHSLLAGIWVLPLLVAGLLWLLDRWQVRRGKAFASGLEMRFGWLLALAFIGCLTHPLLDWQTAYAIQLFAPVDQHWYHTDALFIADLWIVIGLGLAIWRSRWRQQAGRGGATIAPRVALAALVGFIGLNAAISWLAADAANADVPYARPDTLVASPLPVLFWRRDVVWREDHLIWRGRYDPLHAVGYLTHVSRPVPDGMSDPLAHSVLTNTPELASFRRWSILPMARIERARCRVTLRYSDARFSERPGAGPLSRSVDLPTGASGC